MGLLKLGDRVKVKVFGVVTGVMHSDGPKNYTITVTTPGQPPARSTIEMDEAYARQHAKLCIENGLWKVEVMESGSGKQGVRYFVRRDNGWFCPTSDRRVGGGDFSMFRRICLMVEREELEVE